MTVLQTAGLSHSEIRGSKVICTYPRLIAAYHVLHRLCEPRHPPFALSYFLAGVRVKYKINIKQTIYRQDLLILSAVIEKLHKRDLFFLTYSLACFNMSKNVREKPKQQQMPQPMESPKGIPSVENNGFEPL